MKFLFAILVLLTATLPLSAQTNGPARLALISESDETANVAALLTAQLSGNTNVQLLERDQVAKIYREQALSSANKDYLKLGQLLGADGLLLMGFSGSGPDQGLNIRLVAVKPGVVLDSERFSWPMANLTDWASAFAGHLGNYLPKLSVQLQDAIPLSVVSLHSAVNSAKTLETERGLNSLLLQRLSEEPRLFVLEREKMQLLSDEHDLQGLDSSTFWKGSYLLEGLFDRDGYSPDTMTISAQLIPPHNGIPQPIELSINRTNLAGAVDQLAKKVGEMLKLQASAPAWNAADEAQRFFSEARWAYRCGLIVQAQAACESAWALGNHTRELAVLRIQAYGEEITTPAGLLSLDPSVNFKANLQNKHSHICVPAVPEVENLPTITRALALFCEDVPLEFTNSVLDQDWYVAGMHLIRESGALLDGFYRAAELRAGHEDQLADLRVLGRRVLSIMDTRAPALAEEKFPHVPNPKFQMWLHQDLEMYDSIRWEEGGLFFERPEESLPLFQRMIEEGFIGDKLFRLSGWNWNDRRRIPEIAGQFLEKLSAETNAVDRLSGEFLAVAKTPFDLETTFHAREEDLMTALWNDRAAIFSQADCAQFIPQTKSLLQKKYGDINSEDDSVSHTFVMARRALRKEYLTTQTNFNRQVFGALFPYQYLDIGPEEAREITPLMEKFAVTNRVVLAELDALRKNVSEAQNQPGPASPRPVMPAGDPLAVKFIDWRPTPTGVDADRHPEVRSLMVRNHRLWMQIAYMRPDEMPPYHTPVSYEAVDPASGVGEEIPLPKDLGNPEDGFEVTSDSLFVSMPDHLLRYRFDRKTWETIPVPMFFGAQIVEFAGKLYLAAHDSLLELSPDTGAVRILASARREPALNEMDSLLKIGNSQWFRANGRLGLNINNDFYYFAPTNQMWQSLPGLVVQPRLPARKFFSQEGVLMLLGAFSYRQNLVGDWFDAPVAELLLEGHLPADPSSLGPNEYPGVPKWEWPEAYDLQFPCVAAEGRSLWLLAARKIHYNYFFGESEPIVFKDDRQATLLHFEPGIMQALSVPLRFEMAGRPVDPFDPKLLIRSLKEGPLPLWVTTPEGLVLVCPELSGHWLISWSALADRLAALREAAKRAASGEFKSASSPIATDSPASSPIENKVEIGGGRP